MSRPLEIILARQWCELLSTPALIFDGALRLVFFNDAAGLILGRSFNETGGLDLDEWRAAFPLDDIPPEGDGLQQALEHGVPTQRTFTIEALTGRRRVKLTVWPIDGLTGSRVGLLASLHAVS